jgi:hypothetical protein
MDEMSELLRDPKNQRRIEKMLYLAAKHGDADLVVERLAWGVDPNCTFQKGRTPLIANARGFSPSSATVRALLQHGADPHHLDQRGLTALDYARRKLARLLARPRRRRKSPNLDENNQLQLPEWEQAELEKLRVELPTDLHGDFFRIWWQERLRAARRVFNDPVEVEKIVEMLEHRIV